MRIRQKKIKRLDDRSLRGLNVTVTSRATDSIASAMKNLQLENSEMGLAHLIDALDYVRESMNTSTEIWKRYRKKKKEARAKAEKLKGLLRTEPTWTWLNLEFDADSASGWWDVISDTSGLIDVKNPQSLSEKAKTEVS